MLGLCAIIYEKLMKNEHSILYEYSKISVIPADIEQRSVKTLVVRHCSLPSLALDQKLYWISKKMALKSEWSARQPTLTERGPVSA